jgi:hypothetical protein
VDVKMEEVYILSISTDPRKLDIEPEEYETCIFIVMVWWAQGRRDVT